MKKKYFFGIGIAAAVLAIVAGILAYIQSTLNWEVMSLYEDFENDELGYNDYKRIKRSKYANK